MDDRTHQRLHRAGAAAPWVVAVLAVVAVLVPVVSAWDAGADAGAGGAGTEASAPRRIAFRRPLRGAILPSLQPPAPAPVPVAAAPPVPAVPPTTARPAGARRPAATTGPTRALPPGFAVPGKHYVYVDQPAERAGAPRVAVIGDSLTVGASPGMQAFLRDVHLVLDARVSRAMQEGVQAAATTRASSADLVVLALGTNDSCAAAECRRRVDALLAAVGDRPVLWLLPARFRSGMDAVLGAIDAAADRRRAPTTQLGWQAWLDRHPEVKAADGVHLTAEGYRLRAQVTADEVHRLLEGVTRTRTRGQAAADRRRHPSP